MEWRQLALCRKRGTENFWLPGRPTPEQYQEVIDKWCAPCPVRGECLLACIQQEIALKYTSQGIQGGATRAQRATLRRKIRESKLCVVEGVMRWLHGLPISRPPAPQSRRYTVTLSHPTTGLVVYRHTAATPKGGHLILVREQKRQGSELVGTVRDTAGRVIEVLPPMRKGQRRSYPSPGQ
ncbi:WhiB family transcriptional regulator [Nonomuraea sp. NPDC050451]|uniref:WhiB family transcriptional regulator n=1 Tax=Nonomuraea sp. NPDC050451 TaxID=3364364 RepID=UPI00378CF2B1